MDGTRRLRKWYSRTWQVQSALTRSRTTDRIFVFIAAAEGASTKQLRRKELQYYNLVRKVGNLGRSSQRHFTCYQEIHQEEIDSTVKRVSVRGKHREISGKSTFSCPGYNSQRWFKTLNPWLALSNIYESMIYQYQVRFPYTPDVLFSISIKCMADYEGHFYLEIEKIGTSPTDFAVSTSRLRIRYEAQYENIDSGYRNSLLITRLQTPVRLDANPSSSCLKLYNVYIYIRHVTLHIKRWTSRFRGQLDS